MVVNFLLIAAAILLLIPVIVIFAQVISAFLANPREFISTPNKISIAILVPAHNEEAGIATTINSIL